MRRLFTTLIVIEILFALLILRVWSRSSIWTFFFGAFQIYCIRIAFCTIVEDEAGFRYTLLFNQISDYSICSVPAKLLSTLVRSTMTSYAYFTIRICLQLLSYSS